MDIPHVNAVGILERPEGYTPPPREYPPALKAMALLLLVIFSAVTLVTTIVSLGAYCLTTDTGDVRRLPESYRKAGAEDLGR